MIVDLVLNGADIWDAWRRERESVGHGYGSGVIFAEDDQGDGDGHGQGTGRGFGNGGSGDGRGFGNGSSDVFGNGYGADGPYRQRLHWSIP